MNKELASIVKNDLDHLSRDWNKNPDDSILRDDSVRLRRLLVENVLLKVWKELEFANEPIIIAPSLEQLQQFCPPKILQYAKAGGAEYQGAVIGSIIQFATYDDPQLQAIAVRAPRINLKSFNITEFKNSACIILNGVPFSREKLILYVANKLGGVHYDERRQWPIHKELDALRALLYVVDKDAAYHELLSLGQHFINAPDINRLHEKLNQIIPQ